MIKTLREHKKELERQYKFLSDLTSSIEDEILIANDRIERLERLRSDIIEKTGGIVNQLEEVVHAIEKTQQEIKEQKAIRKANFEEAYTQQQQKLAHVLSSKDFIWQVAKKLPDIPKRKIRKIVMTDVFRTFIIKNSLTNRLIRAHDTNQPISEDFLEKISKEIMYLINPEESLT